MGHISESYAEYLEPESPVQILGALSDELAQPDPSNEGCPTVVDRDRPLGYYIRFPADVPR